MIKVEYLIPFDTSDNICKNEASFISLLKTNTDIEIKKNKISYMGDDFKITIEVSEIEEKQCSVFHIILEWKNIKKFRNLNIAFQKTLRKNQNNIQIIWDGIWFEYSQKLYALTYEVENLMRMLVSKFMLNTLGIWWSKSATPEVVKSSIEKKKKNEDEKLDDTFLYELDFIFLSRYLLQKYSNKTWLEDFIKKKEASWESNINFSELEWYLPKNNWDRYFWGLLNLSSKDFAKKWDKMYQYRNEVAHNRSISEKEYNDCKELWEGLKEILKQAFNEISNIEIVEQDYENLSKLNVKVWEEYTRVNSWKDINVWNSAEFYSAMQWANEATLKIQNTAKLVAEPFTGVINQLQASLPNSLYNAKEINNAMLPNQNILDATQNLIIKTPHINSSLLWGTLLNQEEEE